MKSNLLPLFLAFAAVGASANAQDGAAFQAVQLTYDKATSDGEWEHSVRIEVDGRVTVERSRPATKQHQLVEGQASAAELRGLTEAVIGARLGTIPASLLTGIPSLNPQYFRLVVQGEGACAGETGGEQRRYGEFADRIGPLVGAALKIAKRVRSEAAAAPSPEPDPDPRTDEQPFARVTLRYEAQDDLGQGWHEREISVDGSGRVRVTPGGAPGAAAAEGQATADELASLVDAVRQARLRGVPGRIPGIPSFAPRHFSLSVESSDEALAGATAGEVGRYGEFADRLRPVLAAVVEIGTRVGSAPVVEVTEDAVDTPFDSVTLIYQEHDGAGTWEYVVVIDGSGKVELREDHPAADVGGPTVGRLTDAELDALAAAVRGARLSDVPQRIPGVPSLNPEGFQIAVGSSDPALAGGTSGERGRYGAFEDQLRPLIGTIVKLKQRVATAPQEGMAGALGQ